MKTSTLEGSSTRLQNRSRQERIALFLERTLSEGGDR